MLEKDNWSKFIFIILLFSCNTNNENKNIKYFETSRSLVGNEVYINVYSNCRDSLDYWILNKISTYSKFSKSKVLFLDSLFCFNSNKSRFITALLEQDTMSIANSDGINVFYGEKINSQWFFFQGDYFIIPREMFEGQDIHTPLSYQQLHEAALKNVYGGYLTPNGKINEAWFIHHFEGIGWGDFNNQTAENDWYLKGRRFKTRKEFFEAAHLDKVKVNWASRDTTKPIIPLPAKNLP